MERASVSAISLRHILASPGYAPGTIAVKVTWMKRVFNACQMHRSMYPSIFNRFPVIQPVSSKVHHFSTFLHILASPVYALGTIAVNIRWMERGFNAGQTRSSIYPSIFNRLWAIARYWSEIATFSYPLAFNAMVTLEFREKFGPQKTRIMGATRHWRQFDDRLSRLDTIPACDGQTDGHVGETDVQPISITCTVWLTHVKNEHGLTLTERIQY